MKKLKSLFLFLLPIIIILSSSFTGKIPLNKFGLLLQQEVDGWYFRAISGYPAAISFELVVLFKNGDFYEIGKQPLEKLNISQSKAKEPINWGKWKKSGQTFYLTNNKEKTYDYQLGTGNWFPAYAYTGNPQLKKSYENTAGGDYGNGTNALFKTNIVFVDGIHFTHSTNNGVSTYNAAAWNKSSSAGTYKITAHRIILTYGDGKIEDQSFALGASGSPAKPTTNMIFIGGDAYVDQD